KTSTADGSEPFDNIGMHFQHPRAGMADDLASRVQEFPTNRLHLMPLPIVFQCHLFEQYEKIVSEDTDSKEHRIRRKLPARHSLHAKTTFQFFDPVLGCLASLAVPRIGGFRTLAPIARNQRVTDLQLAK